MTSSAEFLSYKILAGAFAVGLISGLCQLEVFTGECGINSWFLHIPLVVSVLMGFTLALALLLDCRNMFGLSAVSMHWCVLITYSTMTFSMNGSDIPACDRILIEIGIVALMGWNSTVTKMFIARFLISTALSKYMNVVCDGSWFTFSSFKSDALNQPFPFTPVWHIAQLPDTLVESLSVLIVISELLLPIILIFSTTRSPFESASATGIVGLCIFYALIGNFNWSILILLSCTVRFITPSVLTLVLGEKTFIRWGMETSQFSEEEAERELIQTLLASTKLFIAFISLVIGCKFLLLNDISVFALYAIPYRELLASILWIITGRSFMKLVSAGPKHMLFMVIALAVSQCEWVTLMSLGRLKFSPDYSTLPTCYTFKSDLDFPVHSNAGRAAFLFQTKYSQLGTNTIGSDLGGTKYAELSIPGSVHADEQRPPFLLGHFPRLALKLWKMGTGNQESINEGLVLIERLSQAVRDGSDAVHVLFPNTPQYILSAHVGKTNQIQSFYQDYTVTSRAADHQWWKRSYDKVSALPFAGVSAQAPIRVRCSVIVPPKIMDVSLELILLMGTLGALLVKLLFSSSKAVTEISKKQK